MIVFNLENPIHQRCSYSQRTLLWGQIMSGSDHMQEELERMGATREDIKAGVAVLDSGFDRGNKSDKSDYIVSPRFETELGYSSDNIPEGEEKGDPNLDENGHGTAVAGLIGGANGIGLAPLAKLAVYRVTLKGNREETQEAFYGNPSERHAVMDTKLSI